MTNYSFELEDTIAKIKSVLPDYDKIRIAYSGGSDSDVVLHLIKLAGFNVKAVFYDTGIEWQATKNHVEHVKSLGYEIDTINADRPVPISNRDLQANLVLV